MKKSALHLRENRGEFSDETINSVNETFDRPENGFGIKNLRLVESYIKGDFRLIFRASIAQKEWLAYFQRFPESRCGELGSFSNEIISPVASVKVQGDLPDSADSHEQTIMLVGNVQFVEYPEIVALPVFVRFGTPDFVLGHLRHSLYLSSKRGFVNLGALKNGEASLIRNDAVVCQDKLARKMIQSASQIVNSIPGDGANSMRHRIDLAHEEQIKILISGIRVWLGVDDIRFTVDKPIPSDFQIHEMLFGPFDFYSNKSESFIGG